MGTPLNEGLFFLQKSHELFEVTDFSLERSDFREKIVIAEFRGLFAAVINKKGPGVLGELIENFNQIGPRAFHVFNPLHNIVKGFDLTPLFFAGVMSGTKTHGDRRFSANTATIFVILTRTHDSILVYKTVNV
jgi:hypothetical protein